MKYKSQEGIALIRVLLFFYNESVINNLSGMHMIEIKISRNRYDRIVEFQSTEAGANSRKLLSS